MSFTVCRRCFTLVGCNVCNGCKVFVTAEKVACIVCNVLRGLVTVLTVISGVTVAIFLTAATVIPAATDHASIHYNGTYSLLFRREVNRM